MRTALVAAGLLLWIAACDDGPPPGPPASPPVAWSEATSREADALEAHLEGLGTVAGGLSVRLAFGEAADLDLYATGPFEETVYYANTPSRIGGALLEDRRCVHDGPRVETIRFPPPLSPGRYRVGVDYPHACGESRGPAPFAVRVDGPGGRTEARGLARYRTFEPIVLELDVTVEANR